MTLEEIKNEVVEAVLSGRFGLARDLYKENCFLCGRETIEAVWATGKISAKQLKRYFGVKVARLNPENAVCEHGVFAGDVDYLRREAWSHGEMWSEVKTIYADSDRKIAAKVKRWNEKVDQELMRRGMLSVCY
jgi:hypothetical protein